MRKLLILILPLLLYALTFQRYFFNSTLRIDLLHSGNRQKEGFKIEAIIKEGPWPGSPASLIDFLNLGTYRVSLYDFRTGKLIFSRGYSTIFQEWQTTEEAKFSSRTFSESLRMPFPKVKKVILIIEKRNKKGKFTPIFKQVIDLQTARVKEQTKLAAVRVFKIHYSGSPQEKVDILVLSEGYRKEEGLKFRRDAERVGKILLSTPPYSKHKNLINIWAIFYPGAEGSEEPLKKISPKTLFKTAFNALGIPRYMLAFDNRRIRTIASHAPYEALFIMVNTSRYGGGGIFNLYACFASDNPYTPYLLLHEFGHAFAGLGDEYYSSYVSYEDFYPKGSEPWEPNLSATADPEKIKWKALLTPGIPLPTPPLEIYRGKVGAFEGAGYVAKGLYRPSLDCIMKSRGWIPFCPVCQAAIERMIFFHAGKLAFQQ